MLRINRKLLRTLALLGGVVLAAPMLLAEAPAHAPVKPPAEAAIASASTEMANAATNLWTALTPEQQKTAGFEFTDEERMNWHFIPRERRGLTWKVMTQPQRELAHGLLASALSQRGYANAMTIMSLEDVLAAMEKDPKKRDPENYAFSIFGKPGKDGIWGWRVEGHHLSLNFTISGGKGIAAGPVFMGSNPGEVREGQRKGLRVQGPEEDMGFALINAIADDVKSKVIFEKTAPKEIITANARKAEPGAPKGVLIAELKDQKVKVQNLVGYYARRLRGEVAQQDLARIESAGWDKVYFGWAGATKPGEGHYYCIQGPTFLIEFDNTQNNANHVHTVWRDLTDDWGEDLLKKHYEESHK